MAALPTAIQAEPLERLILSGESLERRPGGYWTLKGVPSHNERAPAWYVGLQTVQAMEAKGWISRANVHDESWRDERIVTAEGRAVFIQSKPRNIHSW